MQDLAGTFEFYSLEVEAFSPCSGDETDDLLEDAWNNMLEEGLCGTEGFEEAWDGLDKIEPTEAFLNCDFYNCFYEHLKNEAGDFWCEHLDEIFSADPEYNTLLLDVFEPDGQSGNPEGHAYWFTGEPNNTYMSFRKSDCNSMDQLKTASTFLHESLHASWKLEIIKLGLTTTDYAEIQTLWKIYVNEKYGINIGEHALMAKEFAEIIARELWKLNGGYPETENGWEYYMGYVYEGLEYEFGDIFEQDDIDHWMELKNKLNGANGENHNTYECQN